MEKSLLGVISIGMVVVLAFSVYASMGDVFDVACFGCAPKQMPPAVICSPPPASSGATGPECVEHTTVCRSVDGSLACEYVCEGGKWTNPMQCSAGAGAGAGRLGMCAASGKTCARGGVHPTPPDAPDKWTPVKDDPAAKRKYWRYRLMIADFDPRV